jgi:ribosomal protein L11 methyltransferase
MAPNSKVPESIADLTEDQKRTGPFRAHPPLATPGGWFSLTIESEDPELTTTICFEHGASGTTIEDDRTAKAYFKGPLSEAAPLAERILSHLRPIRAALKSTAAIEDKNWVQQCQEVWQPLLLGSLTIVPVLSLEAAPDDPPSPDEIRVVPGFGFGTGHHATTAMMVELLQSDSARGRYAASHVPFTALDLGTGSGILALVMHRTFGCDVLAVDIDHEALRNAGENLRLNRIPEKAISLHLGTLDAVPGVFPLIAANLYGAVLTKLAGALGARIQPGGSLFLSGVTHEEAPGIRSLYTQQGLMLTSEVSRGGWVALEFVRPHPLP